jgi:hypothetical protein
VYRAGDGVLAHRRRDGTVFYEHVSYDANTPAYLSYLLTEEDRSEFLGTVQSRTVTFGERAPSGEWLATEMIRGAPRLGGELFSFANSTDLVLLFTDGIESFQNLDGSLVPIESILDEILTIKNFKGQFLSRRCSRFLSKTCVERGWKHADDFAVAGIYIGDGS